MSYQIAGIKCGRNRREEVPSQGFIPVGFIFISGCIVVKYQAFQICLAPLRPPRPWPFERMQFAMMHVYVVSPPPLPSSADMI